MTFINTCREQHKRVKESKKEPIKVDAIKPTIYVNKFPECGITTYYDQLRKYSHFNIVEISTPSEIENHKESIIYVNDKCAALKDLVDIQAFHFPGTNLERDDSSYIDQIKSCKKIVCVEKRLKRIIKEWLQTNGIRKEVHVIPACFDIPKLTPKAFTSKYQITDFILGSGGEPRKRPDLFIELAKRNINETFVLSREGTTQSLPNLHSIGFVSRAMYLSAVATCKMFICTSISESTPYVILEALSQGKTVISSDYGSGELIIEDGKSGYFFDGTIEDLDRVFKYALWHPISGIERLKDKYYSPKVVKKLDKLFASLLS